MISWTSRWCPLWNLNFTRRHCRLVAQSVGFQDKRMALSRSICLVKCFKVQAFAHKSLWQLLWWPLMHQAGQIFKDLGVAYWGPGPQSRVLCRLSAPFLGFQNEHLLRKLYVWIERCFRESHPLNCRLDWLCTPARTSKSVSESATGSFFCSCSLRWNLEEATRLECSESMQ